jgi:hypothetical protein
MVPAPSILLVPFAADAAGANITFPIPVDPTVTPGQASLSLGFPPVTMVDPVSAAGVPPYGQDFNGIFKMITAYLVWLQGGGGFYFDQDFSDEYGGYAQGSVLQSATDKTRFWISTADNNTTDPDGVSAANWIPVGSGQGRLNPTVAAGTTHNYEPTGWGPSVDVLDIDASMGNATITGLKAGYNGQRVVVTNVGTSVLTLAALGSSLPANQFRLPTDYTLLQYMSLQLQYSTGAGLWIAIP